MRVRRPVTGPLLLSLSLLLAVPASAQMRIDDGTSTPGGTPTAEAARVNMLAFTDAVEELTPGIEVEYFQQRLHVLRRQIAGLGTADLEAILGALQGVPNWCCSIDEMRGCGASALVAAPTSVGACAGVRTDATFRHAMLDAWNAAEVASVIADGACHSAHDGDGGQSNGGLCPGAFVLKGLAWAARFAYDQSAFCHREALDLRIADLIDRIEGGEFAVESARGAVAAPAGPASVGAFRFARPFPNPATGEVAFDLVLPESAPVSLRVYDVAGTLVDVVAEGPFGPGRHTFAWDPARVRGGLAPGIYFARLEAGARHANQRVVVSR